MENHKGYAIIAVSFVVFLFIVLVLARLDGFTNKAKKQEQEHKQWWNLGCGGCIVAFFLPLTICFVLRVIPIPVLELVCGEGVTPTTIMVYAVGSSVLFVLFAILDLLRDK